MVSTISNLESPTRTWTYVKRADGMMSGSASASASATSTSNNYNGDNFFNTSSSSWAWQRWALFAIFIIFIVLAILGLIRANFRRARRGVKPIAGTSWFTPPTYIQSERQNNADDGVRVAGRNQQNHEQFVPQYTEEVNPDDLGYYDDKGLFHMNSKAHPMEPPPDLETGHVRLPTGGPSHYTTTTITTTATPYQNDDLDNMSLTSPEHAAIRQRAREYYYNNNNNNNNTTTTATNNQPNNLERNTSSIEMTNYSTPQTGPGAIPSSSEMTTTTATEIPDTNRSERMGVHDQVTRVRLSQTQAQV